MYPLAKNGVFWTLQGEGALVGEPMAFIRLAGCSVGCPQCDTDYRVGQRLTTADILYAVQRITPKSFKWPWAWLTGGEPTDHDLAPLVDGLQTIGYRVALATAGVKPVDHLKLQWISVSPHHTDIAQTRGHELKIVPGLNGLTWTDVDAISRWSFPYRFLQPLWGDRDNESACLDYVQTHPGWRLSPQAHKIWRIA